MGYASAQLSYLGVGALLFGFIIAVISIAFKLRLIPISTQYTSGRENNVFGVVSIPILLIILLPLMGLVLWGFNLAVQYDSFIKFRVSA